MKVLDVERERSLIRELHATYQRLNDSHFKGALKTPQLSLSDATSFFARFVQETRTIEIARMLLDQAWGSVIEVLKHEMAHQFVHEVLGEPEEPHGPAFRSVCSRLGIDARASGLPEARAHDAATARLLERVEKLLALAESDNAHEAEAAAAAAQRLMLRHNLDVPEGKRDESYSFRQLGRITGRVTEWERRLGNLLSEHFFVDVIWVPAYRVHEKKRGSVLEAIGSRENLELAAYVYEFLTRSAERLWLAHKKAMGVRGNKDRLTYYAGVMSGFAQKLATQARAHRADGLVWRRSERLEQYTRKRHPYLRTVTHQGHRPSGAFAEGQRAGREVVLHKGLTTRGSSGETRLLRG